MSGRNLALASSLRLFAVLAALWILLPQRVAASTLEFSETSIVVQSEIVVAPADISSNPAERITDGLILPNGTFGEFETLIEPGHGSRFPTSPSSLPGAFISATMNTSLQGAVGVSGIGQFGEVWDATASFGQSVTNRSVSGQPDLTIPVRVDLTIPAGEVSYWTGAGDPVDPSLKNFAEIRLSVVERDPSGAVLQLSNLILFSALIEKQFPRGGFVPGGGLAGLDLIHSFPSQANAGTFDIQDPRGSLARVAGIRWDEFSETVVLDLLPGHTFDFTYHMRATSFTNIANASTVLDDAVYGGQALIGDPFNISGSSGGSITIGSVPEPGLTLLMGFGLGGLARLGRKRPSNP
jgi:hypothetical protein